MNSLKNIKGFSIFNYKNCRGRLNNYTFSTLLDWVFEIKCIAKSCVIKCRARRSWGFLIYYAVSITLKFSKKNTYQSQTYKNTHFIIYNCENYMTWKKIFSHIHNILTRPLDTTLWLIIRKSKKIKYVWRWLLKTFSKFCITYFSQCSRKHLWPRPWPVKK